MIAVTLINGALFGYFSYMSDYLKMVAEVSYSVISGMIILILGILAGYAQNTSILIIPVPSGLKSVTSYWMLYAGWLCWGYV